MFVKLTVLAFYFIVVLVLGILAKRRIKDSPSEYFLAGRTFGPFVLIGTMAATNFSAFTVFGTSGAGYRDGLAFFPIIGFGTGFMAISFWIIGRKAWQLGREHGLISPAELVGYVYKNELIKRIFAIVLIIFTIPYLAIQPIAGGYAFTELFGMSQFVGAAIITLTMVIYILRGGMRAVALTDIFQGFFMIFLLVFAFVMVASHLGGLKSLISITKSEFPELLSRPGLSLGYPIGIWFSYILLWSLCDPMFPQLFQRFFTAKSERAIAWMMVLYPAICTIVFLPPVLLGTFGRHFFPNIIGKETDNVISMIATKVGGDFLGTLILAAGIAALMSTMSSQLLTLSSIFTRDILPIFTGKKEHTAMAGRIFVVSLAVAGLLIAVKPPATILSIATWAFTGFAVLFPTVLFGMYLKKPSAIAAIVSILVGEILVFAFAMKWISIEGFLPVIPIIVSVLIIYIVIQLASCPLGAIKIHSRNWGYLAAFILIFALAMDFWRWNKIGTILLGLPLWIWYFIILSAAQTLVMYFWVRSHLKRET